MRCCPYSPPGSLHALGASKSLHAVTSLLNWYKIVCMGDLSQGLVLIKKKYEHIFHSWAIWNTQVCWLKRYCGFNRELFFFNVCKCPRSPQTLAAICRSIDIYGGFRAVAAREKYPGFIFVVAIDGELEILNCWYFGEILPFYKRTNRRYSGTKVEHRPLLQHPAGKPVHSYIPRTPRKCDIPENPTSELLARYCLDYKLVFRSQSFQLLCTSRMKWPLKTATRLRVDGGDKRHKLALS